MSPRLTSKIYDALSQRLERMADGIRKHFSEPGFPMRLSEADRRAWRQNLEDLRSRYEHLSAETARAFDSYSEEARRIEAQLSQDDDSLRGLYGKKSPILSDFGTRVSSQARAKASKDSP